MPKRIVVIVNKDWEADPLVAVLRHKKARPPSLPPPTTDTGTKARLAFGFPNGVAEIWCISDLLTPPAHPSSSQAKWDALQPVFVDPPAVVVAVGTASFAQETSFNGCVSLGTAVFGHDAYPTGGNPKSNWKHPQLGGLVASKLPEDFFRTISTDVRLAAEARFLVSPIAPAMPPRVLAVHGHAALGVVNVTNYNDYAWTDKEAVAAFKASAARSPIGSMETTHVIIRLAGGDVPFLFVSGIANRLGHFDYESAPRTYAQDFVAAHNAGVTLAWLLPELARLL
jgi:hypothetical protein